MKPRNEFEQFGCKFQRLRGSEMGRRGRAASKYGYRITHLATGKVNDLYPNADGGVKESTALSVAEVWAKNWELKQ